MPAEYPLSVIVPTVPGRDASLERMRDSILATTPHPVEFMVMTGYDNAGRAWNEGCERATAPIILLSADDLDYAPGWWEACTAVLERGAIPCPVLMQPCGGFEPTGEGWYEDSAGTRGNGEHVHLADGEASFATVIPIFTREMLDRVMPVGEVHYFSDDWFSMNARAAGIQLVVARGFVVWHHLAMAGRHGAARSDQDRELYVAAGGTFG